MAAPVVEWVCRELSKLMGFDATEEIANYILAIDNVKDLEDYLCDLMDPNVARNRKFIDELKRKWRPPAREVEVPNDIQIYQKKAETVDDFVGSTKSKKKNKKQNEERSSPVVVGVQASQQNGALPGQHNTTPPKSKKVESESVDVKKKTKFVPLFSEDGEMKTVAKLPGRHTCECQAAKHTLINNCTKCGRVVCEQEGSGPCVFCGNLVCTKEEQEVLARGSKKSDQLRQRLMKGEGRNSYISKDKDQLPNASQKMSDGYEKAMKHKNRLLDYDRTSVKRTQVIDDESDYFSTDSNRWLSKSERTALKKREEELRNLKHASRKDRKITLDFAGRRVVESEDVVDIYDTQDSVIQDVYFGAKKSETAEKVEFTDEDFTSLINPGIQQPAPQFVPTGDWANRKKSDISAEKTDTKKKPLRIQDKELQEMSDEGYCMSMHQPWATLLTSGIKKHEGRSWYTPHRGRLWIAATAKKPVPQEIADVEQQYRIHYDDADLEFPDEYPTGCLLGCVDVIDCLAQEDYQEKFPDGESQSPYVFICENPQELVLKFPMKGKHKIYKLDGNIHQGAKKGLRR